MSVKKMRVRFAPSPTGPFHIGGARSALFNWLLARHYGGQLILRIEDTDLERSSRESEENIKDALRWLGIDWDEGIDVGGNHGPYRQTERLPIYEEYTRRLLASGRAYRCYCTDEELEADRQEALRQGLTPQYKGKCRHLSAADEKKLIAEGRIPTIRFRVPENQVISFHDAMRGTVSFDSNGIGDYVIVKSDGFPVYNYAVVLDDALMEITHVVRAEEHLSNTPRQILIYEALGLLQPEFAHISLILGKDRSKMSKRHGATSVEQYKALGYLPEAVVNYLALLGWAPPGEQEILSKNELVEWFSLDHVAANPAVFDIDKLKWLNSCYLKKMDLATLTVMALPYLQAAGLIDTNSSAEQLAWIKQVVAVVRDYISFVAQIPEHAAMFFYDDVTMENEETAAVLKDSGAGKVLELLAAKLAAVDQVTGEQVSIILKDIGNELSVSKRKVFMPVRVALTGKIHGPEITSIIPLLGVDRAMIRIRRGLALASSSVTGDDFERTLGDGEK